MNTIYIAVYNGKGTIEKTSYIIEAVSAGAAHKEARRLFGKGISFLVREATPVEIRSAIQSGEWKEYPNA